MTVNNRIGRPEDNQLAKAIAAIREILSSNRIRFAIRDPQVLPSHTRLLAGRVFAELGEIATILEMIYETAESHRVTQARLLDGKFPSGTVDATTKLGKEFLQLFEYSLRCVSRQTIHIKALYEWLYHLKELIEADRALKRLVEPVHWAKLTAYCDFRDRLITHKSGLKGPVLGGMIYSADMQKIELNLVVLGLPQSAIRELDTLFNQCASELTAEESTEANVYERCRILSRQLYRFRDHRRGRIVAFFGKYGTRSQNPGDIAEFVAEMCADLIPKLEGVVN